MGFDISSFGAAAGGAICTAAIQKAIDACAMAGGGEVVVPAGRFVTGTLHLKSGVGLHLSAGAVLAGSPHITDYAADVHRNMYANEGHLDRCLIFARGASHIALTGRGMIDGQGASFPNAADGARHRPMLIRLVECQDVLLRDVALLNAGSWSVAALYCGRINVDNLRIESRAGENCDGLDFDGCHDVRLSNCLLNTSGDGICLQASRTDRACENIAISNCLISGANTGFRVGLLSLGTIRDVAMSNCVFRHVADAAIKIQVNEGGIVENIRIGGTLMREVLRALQITLSRHRVCVASMPGIPPMGAVRGVQISGLRMQTCRTPDRKAAIIIAGSRDGKIEDVSICDAEITVAGGAAAYEGRVADVRELGASRPEHRALGSALPSYGLYARHVHGLRLANVRFHPDLPDARPAQVLDDVTGSQEEGIGERR